MPKIAVYKFIVFFIVSFDVKSGERPHLHFSKTKKGRTRKGKIWLDTLEIENIGDFTQQELRKMLKIVTKHQDRLIDEFNKVKEGKFKKTLTLT